MNEQFQNEEEILGDKVTFAFCQIVFPKLALMGLEKKTLKKLKKLEKF